MNIVSRLLRHVPKRFVPVGIAVVAIAIPAVVMAWGPDRPTYTMAHPADHVTFDSITDNPEVGDERNFLSVKDASNTAAGGWQNNVAVQAGHEYLVRVYVHNDAASNLNLKATNVRTKVNVPTTTGKSVELGGFITSDNASPQQIWSSATLTSSNDFNVAYEAGTARLFNNAFGQTGAQLSDNIVTSAGAQLGYDKLDGVIPGCMQFSGYVTFKIKVQGPQQTSFTMSKMVSKHGANQWAKSYAAQPGETVDYLIQYKNTGDTQQDNVVVKDTLPAGETYVAGSSILGNSKTPTGAKISDNVVNGGVNIGSYAAGANGWVIFSAKLADNDNLPVCGANTLTNNATVETDTGNKSDTATVTTKRTCVAPPTPAYECTALDVATISRTQFKFTASKHVDNAQFEKFTFVVSDAQGKQLVSQDSTDGTFTYTQNNVGTYTAQATVVVMVNGQEKTATSDNCKKSFQVTPLPVQNSFVCSTLTPLKKSRDTFAFTVSAPTQGNVSVKEYNFDFGDHQSIIVGAGQETQTHTYNAPSDYTATVTVSFNVDNKTVTGITSDSCTTKVTVEQPPVTPPTTPPAGPAALPNTGSELAVGGLFGSGAIGLGVNSWLGSRRKVRGSFKR